MKCNATDNSELEDRMLRSCGIGPQPPGSIQHHRRLGCSVVICQSDFRTITQIDVASEESAYILKSFPNMFFVSHFSSHLVSPRLLAIGGWRFRARSTLLDYFDSIVLVRKKRTLESTRRRVFSCFDSRSFETEHTHSYLSWLQATPWQLPRTRKNQIHCFLLLHLLLNNRFLP